MSKSLPFNPQNTWNDQKEPLAHKRIVERSTTKKKSIITTSYLVSNTYCPVLPSILVQQKCSTLFFGRHTAQISAVTSTILNEVLAFS